MSKSVTINAWKTEWHASRKFLAAPIAITVFPDQLILLNTGHGKQLVDYVLNGSVMKYEPDVNLLVAEARASNDAIAVKWLGSEDAEPRYGVKIIPTEVSYMLTKEEYDRLASVMNKDEYSELSTAIGNLKLTVDAFQNALLKKLESLDTNLSDKLESISTAIGNIECVHHTTQPSTPTYSQDQE